ncbi:MAG: sigma-70 family RNA polymerase sigma factor [Bdellovibrionaceae bacterium]|nr:sigma-70 family RNA polymerase sigma factor [Pseudobdellovibrionaceae bacterium]
MDRDLLILTDQDLVEKTKEGDRRAFSELVRRHQKALLRLSLRFMKDLDMAQDIVQEAFIKAYEKLGSFEGRSSFKSWLYQITINAARNRLREGRHGMTDINNVRVAVGPSAEKRLVHSAVADLIQGQIEKLPARQKEALMLRVYEDLSFAEIAEIMDCPYDTAKANYRHALLKLKEAFQADKELQRWTYDVDLWVTELRQPAEVEV